MINEQEKKATISKMSDLEYAKNDVEMMRYRTNGLSHKLGLLGMAFSTIGMFICLNSMKPNNIQVLLIVLMNIVIILGGFLACEKAKSYSAKGSIALAVFGAICAARIFYVPIILIKQFDKYDSAYKIVSSDTATLAEKATARADMTAAAYYLDDTITAYYGGTYANAFLSHSGNVRAVFAIICFALAAAGFIAAGVLGVMRSKKLSTYLDSIKEKN